VITSPMLSIKRRVDVIYLLHWTDVLYGFILCTLILGKINYKYFESNIPYSSWIRERKGVFDLKTYSKKIFYLLSDSENEELNMW
jgi:hypothetical protein